VVARRRTQTLELVLLGLLLLAGVPKVEVADPFMDVAEVLTPLGYSCHPHVRPVVW
jgi:hypothetical protein